MVLVLDFGNTQIKTAVFEHNTLLEDRRIFYERWQNEVEKILALHTKIETIVVASVKNNANFEFLQATKLVSIVFISHDSKFPFTNLYKTPKTLGIDRMILAAGAVFQFPNKNRLIIDAGTCITYDFVDKKDNYLGGAISPGIRLRYESLHNYTDKLPSLTIEMPETTIGTSTNQAIHSGVVKGVLFEIEGFAKSYFKNDDNFIIILTGGDSIFLANRLKNTIFANSNFLLESLNQTFQYNQQ